MELDDEVMAQGMAGVQLGEGGGAAAAAAAVVRSGFAPYLPPSQRQAGRQAQPAQQAQHVPTTALLVVDR